MPAKTSEFDSNTGRPLILWFTIICAASVKSASFAIVIGSYFIMSLAKKIAFIPAGINLCARLRVMLVPPIMKWILTGCDINKDVTVSDKLQLTAINIQLKEADRVFRLYIKSLGDKAVYRVEELVKMRCSLVDVLRTIRSPSELR